jgi:uncharacterized UBP type Zn finger protein
VNIQRVKKKIEKLKGKLNECVKCKEDTKNRKKTKPKDIWICLQCFHLGCGRDDKEHAVKHNIEKSAHNIVLNVVDLRLWCYSCDFDLGELRPLIDTKKFKEKLSDFIEEIQTVFQREIMKRRSNNEDGVEPMEDDNSGAQEEDKNGKEEEKEESKEGRTKPNGIADDGETKDKNDDLEEQKFASKFEEINVNGNEVLSSKKDKHAVKLNTGERAPSKVTAIRGLQNLGNTCNSLS